MAAARRGDMTGGHATTQLRVSDTIGGLGAVAQILRMILQSGMLALGAYLAIRREVTAGSIIAAGILTSRALAPVEFAIGNWKNFLARATDGSGSRHFSMLLPAAAAVAVPRPN